MIPDHATTAVIRTSCQFSSYYLYQILKDVQDPPFPASIQFEGFFSEPRCFAVIERIICSESQDGCVREEDGHDQGDDVQASKPTCDCRGLQAVCVVSIRWSRLDCSINHVTDMKQGEDLSMASKSESGNSSSSSVLSIENKKVLFLDSKFVTYLYSSTFSVLHLLFLDISDKSLSAKVKQLMNTYLHTLTKLSLYQKDLSKLVDKIVALK